LPAATCSAIAPTVSSIGTPDRGNAGPRVDAVGAQPSQARVDTGRHAVQAIGIRGIEERHPSVERAAGQPRAAPPRHRRRTAHRAKHLGETYSVAPRSSCRFLGEGAQEVRLGLYGGALRVVPNARKPPSSECRHHVRPGSRRVVAAQRQRREDSAAVGVAVRQSGRGDRLADLAPDILALGETGERSNGDRVVRRVADRDLRPLRAWIRGSCAPRA
jgi:hypothetical protein